ncbi:hypothetical protein A3E86_01425 [Candidatus Daviesbacteria bacterium RIFCSPHIGHO2_12_FULL_47_45]|nr:MAG: hypothetical protein A3E86_01425 [Candidatus Daviesbacteria bacterium RIFCSPHIGHO2_12_FULL_47_45]
MASVETRHLQLKYVLLDKEMLIPEPVSGQPAVSTILMNVILMAWVGTRLRKPIVPSLLQVAMACVPLMITSVLWSSVSGLKCVSSINGSGQCVMKV